MVLDMDNAITEIVSRLKALDLYNDTIIVFTTDNGGAISHGASNWPLRGTKGTMFEGGTRAVSFVHAPSWLEKTGYVNSRLLHITDWMPTLLRMAQYPGDPAADLGLDGVDQWTAISRDEVDARQEMVYNLKMDPVSGAIRVGNYKLLFGKKFNKQGWYDVDNTALQCSRFHKNKKLKRMEALERKDKKEKKKLFKKDKEEKLDKTEKIKKDKNMKEKHRQINRDGRKLDKEDRKRKKKLRKRKKNKDLKQEKKQEKKQDKKIQKIWKEWLPEPNSETQELIRYCLATTYKIKFTIYGLKWFYVLYVDPDPGQ